MAISQYRDMLSQAFNIANLMRGGEFRFETEEDEQNRALREYQNLKKKGKI